MKRLVFSSILILFMVALLVFSFKKIFGPKDRSGYGNAAEWGCYQEALRVCANLESEQEATACEEDALQFCPKIGEAFKKFMEQGKKPQ